MYGKKSLQYCKVISLQLIKINEKRKKKKKARISPYEKGVHFWATTPLCINKDLRQYGFNEGAVFLESFHKKKKKDLFSIIKAFSLFQKQTAYAITFSSIWKK